MEIRKEAAWLQNLHAVDRAVARRWLARSSETQMRRIFQAMEARRGAGAPKKPVPDEWTRLAIELFLASNGRTVGQAAGLAARELHQRNIANGTAPNTRRKITKELAFLEKPRVADLKRIAPIADDLEAAGKPTRTDLFPAAGSFASAERRRVAGQAAFYVRSSGWVLPTQAEPAQPTTAKGASMLNREMNFFDAFSHLINEDTPITILKRLFDTVEEFIRQEMLPPADGAKTL